MITSVHFMSSSLLTPVLLPFSPSNERNGFCVGERGKEMEGTSTTKRIKTQHKIRDIIPLPDGVHGVATCRDSNQIWKVNLETGAMNVFCGQGERGNDDGQPNQATFNSPSGLAMKANGAILVTDWGNNLIREISPCGK